VLSPCNLRVTQQGLGQAPTHLEEEALSLLPEVTQPLCGTPALCVGRAAEALWSSKE
jgi:hypothetical protein